MIRKEHLTIVAQEELAPNIYAMDLKGEMVGQMKAGQFLHIRVPDDSKLLRRPLSISEIDRKNKIARIIYRVEGAGTEIFSSLSDGFQLDCMGPQGNGFDLSSIKKGDRVLIIGGGIGVPPLVELAKELKTKGAELISVLGFATASAVILEREMALYGEVLVTTDDGSIGQKGYVSSVIDGFTQEFAAVYACGAPGMLRYVDEKFASHPHAYLSMESRMACGMGACYACVVHVKDQEDTANKRVCKDGPVFKTGTVLV